MIGIWSIGQLRFPRGSQNLVGVVLCIIGLCALRACLVETEWPEDRLYYSSQGCGGPRYSLFLSIDRI
ncbi:hypothetical protein BDV09DRAFT_158366, partial [Aspergillus tetrazonus]